MASATPPPRKRGNSALLFPDADEPARLPPPPNISGLIAQLNPEQRKAVEKIEGPLLVLAGAGTGKTRVITTRIAHMVSKGIDPRSILAMTFTNKAAGEMRERIGGIVGKQYAELITAGTFHSFCLELLRKHKKAIGFPKGFSLCDTGDQISTVKGAMAELHAVEFKMRPADALSAISLAKSRLDTPEKLLKKAVDIQEEYIAKVWERYEERLHHSRLLDFDDLLGRTVELFGTHPKILASIQDQFRYLLVDEYQDTNTPQYEIIRHIAQRHKNLCVVGDDDQSIYGWRGADIQNILGFDRDFPTCVTIKLETNYRSTSAILNAANRVIENNLERHEKVLRPHREGGAAIQLFRLADEGEEAQFVVRDIITKVGTPEWSYSDFAILFRTAIQPKSIEVELRAQNVPYVLVGGQSFFDKKEVRDVLAYLRLLVNPADELSLMRIINSPPRGVGRTSLNRVIAFANLHHISVPDAFDRAGEIEGLKPAPVKAVMDLRRLLATLGGMRHSMPIGDLIDRLVESVNYNAELERAYPDPVPRERRARSIEDIKRWAEAHFQKRKKPTLGTFLSNLALNAGESPDRKKDESHLDQVTLMTLHAAKGLEFPGVYLIGIEEGLLPHGRAAKEGNTEEERRLMYVGITRAKMALVLSHTRERNKFGTRIPSMPSRFLYELKGTPPPEDWIPAGLEPEEKAKKKRAAKRKRKPKS